MAPVGSSTGDFERWLNGALEWSVSLYGSSVKATWRAPLLETLEDRRWASLLIGAPLVDLEGSSSTRDFERWM